LAIIFGVYILYFSTSLLLYIPILLLEPAPLRFCLLSLSLSFDSVTVCGVVVVVVNSDAGIVNFYSFLSCYFTQIHHPAAPTGDIQNLAI
jgi:hypothetical protein